MTLDELKRFRQLDSKTPGHPEYFMTAGRRDHDRPARPGPRDGGRHGARRAHARAEFGDDLVDHHTYVLASDGDLMEGISQEAIALAGHLRLSRLIVLFDDNGISIDGPLSLSDSVDQVEALRGRRLARRARRRPRPGGASRAAIDGRRNRTARR